MVFSLVVFGAFGFGLLVLGAIVVGRIRDRRRWSEPSQVTDLRTLGFPSM